MTGAERGTLLTAFAARVEANCERFVTLEALDAGKPLAATRRQDVPAAFDCLACHAGKIHGKVAPARADA